MHGYWRVLVSFRPLKEAAFTPHQPGWGRISQGSLLRLVLQNQHTWGTPRVWHYTRHVPYIGKRLNVLPGTDD